ncbi:MAG: hypothetical protein ACRDQJ_07445 [Pseudonocardiaceae bacterium]
MSPQPYLDRLAVVVMLRQVITLADQAAGITDMELRARLLALAGCAR